MPYQKVEIHGDLAKLNDHDNANRTNKFGGAALKKRMTDLVALHILLALPYLQP